MGSKVVLRIGIAVLLASAGSAYGQDKAAKETPSAVLESASAKTNQNDSDRPALQRRNPRYQLHRSDVVTLDFPVVPEYGQTVTVQPDGYVTLKDVGAVYVEGQTVPELEQTVRQAYSKILHDPVVTADLKDFQKPYFIAFGQVAKPGQYDLRGDVTLTQAVATAGGFDINTAKHSQVLLFRKTAGDWYEVRQFDMKHMFSAQNIKEDIYLQPGDMIYVPQNFISKIKAFIPSSAIQVFGYKP
jgi:polysaccharide export outer membrane protein